MPEWQATEREAYLALALVPGIGAVRLRALLEHFETPSAALAARLSALSRVPDVPAEVATAILQANRAAATRILAVVHAAGWRFLLPEDPDFPEMLASIPDPPTYLFLQGNLALLERPAVAIVGSRDHTRYGAEVCRAVARAAAEAGLVVVSGMARGLDAIAHWGALDAKGDTIGVLGNGLGVIYPQSNRALYEQVVNRGLLLTECLPGERPKEGGFPRRNRLISGLARVTVVVEAAMTSGALQTSRWAQNQGREVLAVPGPITSPVSIGVNDLIRDGAAPLLDLTDLLCHYPECGTRQPARGDTKVPDAGQPLERRLLNALQHEPLQAEQLVELSGAPVGDALDALSTLELSGKVQREQGGHYRLVATGLFR
ncbi:MAG TPA: DNA-processing protein DprA [Gemmatimonadales bacterium]|jgi:DNA processing protein|nr:DNA-processing protein DprA [Gemmatimonadales bacterium]